MSVKAKRIVVLEYGNDPFADRVEAGRKLAGYLKKTAGPQVVVAGIPRGGVVVAREIARVLDAPFDIVLSRKIGAPGNPELAIGAVAEDGRAFLNEEYVRQTGADEDYLEREQNRQMVEIEHRRKIFRSIHPKISFTDRIVVVTDDGVATGATLRAALWSVRGEHPQKVIAAVPVGPEETLNQLAEDAEEVVCARLPDFFSALSQFYIQFDQVEDEEVISLLTANPKERGEP